MTIVDFFALPEMEPVEPPFNSGFGLAIPRIEGEAFIECYDSPDGRGWWSETHDGVRYRRRYAT